jgi:hypothetical protein
MSHGLLSKIDVKFFYKRGEDGRDVVSITLIKSEDMSDANALDKYDFYDTFSTAMLHIAQDLRPKFASGFFKSRFLLPKWE